MKISEVSELLQISKDTIRYYEKIGLIKPIIVHKKREYHQKDVERLQNIKVLKTAQFSLDEILYFIEFDEKYSSIDAILNMPKDDLMVMKSLISNKIKEIKNLKSNLDHSLEVLNKINIKLKEIKQ